MDGYPTNLVAHHLALPRVQACSDLQSQPFGALRDAAGAAYRASRPVEVGQKAVSCRVNLLPSKALELSPRREKAVRALCLTALAAGAISVPFIWP